jgi:cephalosporin hydroxylase
MREPNHPMTSAFHGLSYLRSLREHYPELMDGPDGPDGAGVETVDERLHLGFVATWTRNAAIVGVDPEDRFVRLTERAFALRRDAWATSFDPGPGGLRRVAAACAYRGLIHLKPPSDLVLYSNLIWELQPRTILEFGALQGGSSLWFADQLTACTGGGEVHSFELLDKCIHPSASHPRLQFHRVDLRDLATLDRALFERLPHPWLVVDDAHENLEKLIPFVGGFLQPGDYYVIEDALLRPTPEMIRKAVYVCDALGLVVDTRYTDAFGYNVTCAPNAWFKKA